MRRRNRRSPRVWPAVTCAAAALSLAACATGIDRTASAAAVRVAPDSSSEFVELLENLAALLPAELAGAAVGLSEGDTVSVSFAGNPEFSHRTLFEFGSITKVITANLLAQLATEGIVDPEQAVSRSYPGADLDESWDQITLADLATHYSGLPGFPANHRPVRIFFTGRMNDPFTGYSGEMLVRGIERTKTSGIRQEWRYSNFGYAVLGQALARESGQSYEALARSRILEPLGMNTASLQGWASTNVAPPLTRAGKPGNHWNFDAFAPAGALRGSINDGLRFLSASLGACRLADPLSKANCAAQATTGLAVSSGSQMGLGWVRTSDEGSTVVWHNGGTGGFSTFLGFNPETDTGLVILTNVGDLREIDGMALSYLLREKPP